MLQGFIHREKKTHTYYFFTGQSFQDSAHRFQLMAKFFPEHGEFRIYCANAYKQPNLLNEDNHIAKVVITKKKQFVIKNKHCLYCSKKGSYFCENSKKWLF